MVISRRRKLGSLAASNRLVEVPSKGLHMNSGVTLQATLSKPPTALALTWVGPVAAAARAKKLLKGTGWTETSTWRLSGDGRDIRGADRRRLARRQRAQETHGDAARRDLARALAEALVVRDEAADGAVGA